MKAVIIDNKLEIFKYPFNNFFWKKRVIYEYEIDFIKIDIDIISVCINSKEIIFIPTIYLEQIKEFIKEYNLTLLDKLDVWELICFPFVDRYKTDEELSENMRQLNELSFKQEEIERIRKKVSSLMGWWVTFTMESTSLIHYDVLQARKNLLFFNPFHRRFYWYTMGIALRGFGIKEKP